MTTATAAATAAQLRETAAAHEAAARESIERCDNDGFRSQWASGICAQEDRLQADIVEGGGKREFPGLFDLDGNLVPAKLVDVEYGTGWMLLNERGRCAGWFFPSRAKNPDTARRNNAKKGFYVGIVRVPAYATTVEASRTRVAVVAARSDDGWSADAEIVDNGH